MLYLFRAQCMHSPVCLASSEVLCGKMTRLISLWLATSEVSLWVWVTPEKLAILQNADPTTGVGFPLQNVHVRAFFLYSTLFFEP